MESLQCSDGTTMKTTGHISLGMAFIILPFVYGCQTMRSEATVKIPTIEKPQDETLSRSVREQLINSTNITLHGVDVVSSNGTVYLTEQ